MQWHFWGAQFFLSNHIIESFYQVFISNIKKLAALTVSDIITDLTENHELCLQAVLWIGLKFRKQIFDFSFVPKMNKRP